MSGIKRGAAQDEARPLDHQQVGPTVPRMMLGSQLRRLREDLGLSREQAGEAIWGSDSKISRLELGRTGFKLRDVSDLLTFYGVTDEAERATLLELARQANQRGWWHRYSDVVPVWFQAYLGLEQAASVIRTYEVQFVPGLLQTADYARAVIQRGRADESPEDIEHRVELRMRRQRILDGPTPPHLWAVIDEAALRRPIGGTATMRAQLEHLLDVHSALSHVTIQVLPFQAGAHAAESGAFTYLRLPAGALPDVVYVEQLTGALYPDKPADIKYYQYVISRLVVQARQPEETEKLLHGILRDL